ncbi:hypothetical protein E3P98_00465 [Wallemia ichthyophaga]|nr:hypothetical protein E3P98_00465 [Wallemia ichthyophaga]
MKKWEKEIIKTTIKCKAVHASIVLVASAILSSFDTSAEILLGSQTNALTRSILRWDVFHFLSRAMNSYGGWRSEHEIAFMPGIPLLMRGCGLVMATIRDAHTLTLSDTLIASAFLANLISLLAPLELYRLTRVVYPHYTPAQAAAPALLMAACPPSPPSLLVPYTEAVYTPLALMTARMVAEGSWLTASLVAFAAASTRANGCLLAGFFLYEILIRPVLETRRLCFPPRIINRIAFASLGTIASFAPLGYTQTEAYARLCPQAPFCTRTLPLAYSYVQGKYWDNGLLRYWNVSQIPNFLLSLPVYVVGIVAICNPHMTLRALPHYVLHTLTLILLLCFSNVQIALRFATALPPLWWWVAAHTDSRLARSFVAWSRLWGCVACVLWAAFLPPA